MGFGDGNDIIDGGHIKDTLYGGTGDDILSGNSGNDYLAGYDGDDILKGGTGNDMLYGQDGADYFDGGWGKDYLFSGGADGAKDIFFYDSTVDSYLYQSGDTDVIYSSDDRYDRIVGFEVGTDEIHFDEDYLMADLNIGSLSIMQSNLGANMYEVTADKAYSSSRIFKLLVTTTGGALTTDSIIAV